MLTKGIIFPARVKYTPFEIVVMITMLMLSVIFVGFACYTIGETNGELKMVQQGVYYPTTEETIRKRDDIIDACENDKALWKAACEDDRTTCNRVLGNYIEAYDTLANEYNILPQEKK